MHSEHAYDNINVMLVVNASNYVHVSSYTHVIEHVCYMHNFLHTRQIIKNHPCMEKVCQLRRKGSITFEQDLKSWGLIATCINKNFMLAIQIMKNCSLKLLLEPTTKSVL